jgi:1,5-anhydro-D-fructose reductase (1,5-anhydro-D-mannitol-forming)
MNQNNMEIRWGIIGCGDVTEAKSGPGFQKADHSSLVAVMRRNADLARDYAFRHHVPKWYANADDLINDDEVDAVYIATPPAFHKDYTLQVALAKKPVYVEKPMAINFSECQEMLSICKEKNVPLFVAYYRRALPKFIKIKEIVENGLLGDIRLVDVRFYRPPLPQDCDSKAFQWWRTNPNISGGGYFFDMASHMIDLLHFFFGKIREVYGNFSNQANLYSAEDIVSTEFVFENGIHGTGMWCFTSGTNVDQTQIVGSKGILSFDTFGSGPIEMKLQDQYVELPYTHPTYIQQPLIQTIVNELLGMGKCPSKGASAAMTNWFIDRALGKI